MWDLTEAELQSAALASEIDEGKEYWVNIPRFRSKNRLSLYFDFCPYITKEGGTVLLKDTLCYKSKGFLCQK